MPAIEAHPFERFRPQLRVLAYRLLGSWAEAEDVVQEAWLRWSREDREALDEPLAWLRRVVTNLCLDVLKSARMQRETYIGPWLPEPVSTTGGALGGERVDPETISLAFLALLERLSPLERAAWVLSEAFDLNAEEIATTLAREPAAVRQLLHRAREHVQQGRPRFAPSREEHERVLGAFLAACGTGDVDGLRALLASDVVLRTDGGGRVRAARKEVHGADAVARGVVGIARNADPAFHLELHDVNGWPCVVIFNANRPWGVLDLETDGAQVFSVQMVLNPEKLIALGSRAD